MICIKHPKYTGESKVDLSCKACCTIYVQRIKSINDKRTEDVVKWLEQKTYKKRTPMG